MQEAANSIDRMISVIDSGTVSVTQAMTEHINVLQKSSATSLALKQEQLVLKKQQQAIDEADKKVKMFLLLKEKGVITKEEFCKKALEMSGF
jgi:hypothetical protein